MVKTNSDDPSADLEQNLRLWAEKRIKQYPPDPRVLAPEEISRLLHELEVHQIELEMQNEELRRTQQDLEAARNRYFELYDLAPVGYLTFSEKGLILEANLAAAKLINIERSRLIGMPVNRFITRDDQDIYYLFLKQLFGEEGPKNLELRMLRSGRTPFFVHLDAKVTQSNDGRPVIWATLSDITERKRSEEVLRESKEKKRVAEETQALLAVIQQERDWLSALVNSIDDEVWFADTREKFTLANPSALRNFGLIPLAETDGLDVEKFYRSLEVYRFDGSPRPVEEAPPLRALRGEIIKNSEALIRTPGSGELQYRQSSSAPVRDAGGTIIGAVSVVRDITERMRTEEALRLSEEKFALAFAGNPAAISMTRLEDGRFLEVNDTWVALNGYSRAEVIGCSARQLPLWPTAEAANRFVQELREKGVLHWREQAFRKKSGEGFVARLSAQVLSIGGEKVILSTLVDITEIKCLEEELRKSHEELEIRIRERTADLARSNAELAQFAYVASHDLQEPLRKIQAFGYRLKEKYGSALDDQGRDYIKRMVSAAERMKTLIRDLLLFSRVTTKIEPFSRVDLKHILQEVLEDLETLMEKTGGRVEIGELPAIEADPHQLQQLFQNLIGNALKFHGEEAPVIRIYGQALTRKKLPAVYQIFFQDNGIGFEEKYLDRIFDPFQRLHDRRAYEGTGMGLAICRKIVEHHRGTITAQSRPGHGATFIVTLPMGPSNE